MTKSEEINQILHQHIRMVFKDAINYKELIQAFIERDKKQLLLHGVSQQRELLLAYHKHLDSFNDPTIYNASESMIDDYLANNCG